MNAAIVCSYLALGLSVGVMVYACIVSQHINRRMEKMGCDLKSYDEKRLQNEDYIHQRIDDVARKVHDISEKETVPRDEDKVILYRVRVTYAMTTIVNEVETIGFPQTFYFYLDETPSRKYLVQMLEERLNSHDHILDITVKTVDLKEQS